MRFNIYPTLLDAFGYMLGVEPEAREAAEQALLDRVNRVPEPLNEAPALGTAFNTMVDMIVDGKNAVIKPNHSVVLLPDGTYRAMIGDFVFVFNGDFARAAAAKFTDCVAQVYTEAEVNTMYGSVKLYGYVDELCLDTIFDIKTTAKYTPFKYESHWQHIVYPYCLSASGQMCDIDEFQYVVYELVQGKEQPITGTCRVETYRTTQAERESKLRSYLESYVLPWLLDHKALITDAKIMQEDWQL